MYGLVKMPNFIALETSKYAYKIMKCIYEDHPICNANSSAISSIFDFFIFFIIFFLNRLFIKHAKSLTVLNSIAVWINLSR